MAELNYYETGKLAPGNITRNYSAIYIHQTPKGPITYSQQKFPRGNQWIEVDVAAIPVVEDNLFTYCIELSAVDVGKLNITPIVVTGAQLGTVAGQGIFVHGGLTKWVVDPDGPFTVGFGNAIDVTNDNGEIVARASNTLEVASKNTFLIPNEASQTLIDSGGLTVSSASPVSAGATGTLKIIITYEKVAL